ncbi:MAG: hypothetical protein H7Y00_03825 [Fimbriimonadaceae bacterium]|nr:hypothetical protein [Chitinophagales bacterium]
MNEKIFPTMNIIHGAMVTGMILFFAVLVFLQSGLPSAETDFSSPLMYVAIFLTVFALAFNFLIYPGRIEKVKTGNSSAHGKVTNWKTIFLIRCAITEGAALFCLAGMFVEESAVFMYLFFALLVLFISFFPSRNKIQSELELSSEEVAEL